MEDRKRARPSERRAAMVTHHRVGAHSGTSIRAAAPDTTDRHPRARRRSPRRTRRAPRTRFVGSRHAAPHTPNTSRDSVAASALRAVMPLEGAAPAQHAVAGAVDHAWIVHVDDPRGGEREARQLLGRAAAPRASPDSGTVSLLSSTMNRPRASRAPALLPPAKPRFWSSATSRTHGNRSRTNAAVPSVDPLSTRIVSASTPCCAATASRHASRYCRPFQLTITIERSGARAHASRARPAATCRYASSVDRARPRPRELRRARQAGASHRALLRTRRSRCRDRVAPTPARHRGSSRIAGIAEHLWNRRGTRRDDRRAAGHGFEHRQTEAFVARRVHERRRFAIQRRSVALPSPVPGRRPVRAAWRLRRSAAVGRHAAIDSGQHQRDRRRPCRRRRASIIASHDDRQVPALVQVADVQQERRSACRRAAHAQRRRSAARTHADTPSGATVIRSRGMPVRGGDLAAENSESVNTCAAARALRR